MGFEEGAGGELLLDWELGGFGVVSFLGVGRSLLHSFTAAGPVAVVEVEAFALEDEGADAVLGGEKSVWEYSRNDGLAETHLRLRRCS